MLTTWRRSRRRVSQSVGAYFAPGPQWKAPSTSPPTASRSEVTPKIPPPTTTKGTTVQGYCTSTWARTA